MYVFLFVNSCVRVSMKEFLYFTNNLEFIGQKIICFKSMLCFFTERYQ